MLAGVGVSWYTWLEQGRDIKVSEEVLDAIARVLLLDRDRARASVPAGRAQPAAARRARRPCRPRRSCGGCWTPGHRGPAYIRDRHWNFTDVNEAARTVFGYGDTDHNCLVSFFTNARYRVLHRQWDDTAPEVVAGFRADAARYPDDPEFDRIAEELARVSPEFAELWARHDVGRAHQRGQGGRPSRSRGRWSSMPRCCPLPELPGHHLILHNPAPGYRTQSGWSSSWHAQPGGVTPRMSGHCRAS